MDNLLAVSFEAHCDERNHHRCYAVRVGRDLFGEWTVSVQYGRVAQSGRELRFGGLAVAELQAIVRERLKRRRSAPRRIGCDYRLTALSVAAGFDSRGWLPEDVLETIAASHSTIGQTT